MVAVHFTEDGQKKSIQFERLDEAYNWAIRKANASGSSVMMYEGDGQWWCVPPDAKGVDIEGFPH